MEFVKFIKVCSLSHLLCSFFFFSSSFCTLGSIISFNSHLQLALHRLRHILIYTWWRCSAVCFRQNSIFKRIMQKGESKREMENNNNNYLCIATQHSAINEHWQNQMALHSNHQCNFHANRSRLHFFFLLLIWTKQLRVIFFFGYYVANHILFFSEFCSSVCRIIMSFKIF